ncbi:hypothetical protein SH139x_004916 [Planctomycetaceae bacterium SH139]
MNDSHAVRFICPFCPLRCDDLSISGGTSEMRAGKLSSGGCRRAALAQQSLLEQGIFHDARGSALNISAAAWERAVAILAPAANIQISGGMLDVPTARAGVRLAAALGATINASSSSAGRAVLHSVERQGMVAATLGELARRADSVVLIGNVLDEYPRLADRFLPAFSSDATPRRVLWLDTSGETSPAGTAETKTETMDNGWQRWSLPAEQLIDCLADARQPSPRQAVEHTSAGQALAEWLAAGHTSCWLWASNSLSAAAAAMLVGFVNDLNEARRSMLIPLGDDVSFRATSLWLSGCGGPVDFSSGLPQLLADQQAPATADAQIWIHPYPTFPAHPADQPPLIVVGTPDDALRQRATLVLPAAVPGIESAGTTFRGDGTVSLGWRPPFQQTAAASIGQVLLALGDQVQARRISQC